MISKISKTAKLAGGTTTEHGSITENSKRIRVDVNKRLRTLPPRVNKGTL